MAHTYTLLKDRRGTSAIEFAIVAPIFILVLTTIAAYAIYFGAALSVEQIAADAARYSVAGLTATERSTLAKQYIETATLKNPLLDRDDLKVDVATDPAAPQQFTVSLSYDAKALPIWDLFSFPLPAKDIRRFATIRIGGA